MMWLLLLNGAGLKDGMVWSVLLRAVVNSFRGGACDWGLLLQKTIGWACASWELHVSVPICSPSLMCAML